MRKIKWTYLARDYFLAIRSSRIQKNILIGLRHAKKYPRMFPLGKSKKHPQARVIVEDHFVVLYEFNEDELVVIAIYHQRQIY
jgi:plasmid stabilization system protein ParE